MSPIIVTHHYLRSQGRVPTFLNILVNIWILFSFSSGQRLPINMQMGMEANSILRVYLINYGNEFQQPLEISGNYSVSPVISSHPMLVLLLLFMEKIPITN